MKITAKTSKEQLQLFLRTNAEAVGGQSKDLFDRINYADEMFKKDESKVTRKDLADLAKEVIALLGDNIIEPVKPVAENSLKKKATKKDIEATPEASESDETPQEVVETPTEEKVDKKKSAKKSLGKKKEPKNNDTDSEGTVQKEIFPETLEVDGKKFVLATDIETFDDLYEAYSKEEVIVFAYYWTKKHLKQYDYFNHLLGNPKSFENDLDLCTAVHVSDRKAVAYQVSMYTEAFYTVLPENIEVVDGIRYSGGVEYQIYRMVE